jgi:penicillin-binding protein 1B
MRQISTQPVTLTPPDNIKTVWVDPANGLLANADCAGAKQYPYIAGSEPSEYSPCLDTPVDRAKKWIEDLLPNEF